MEPIEHAVFVVLTYGMKTAPKITAISSIILLLLLLTTNPQKLPSALLVVPFVLLFVVIASGIPAMLGAYGFTGQKVAKIGATVAAVPVLLLVLQSLGQLTVRDTLAVFMLFSLAYFYMSRFGMRFTS